MNATEFRKQYGKLGVLCELLIANVIVGTFNYTVAASIARYALMEAKK